MKKLLIVVDYQNDFVDGALGFSGAEVLEEPIARKIKQYRAAGDPVAFTYDTHQEDYMETEEGKHLPLVHCVEGTPGFELYGSVSQLKQEGDPVFLKPTFGSADLFTWLVEQQPFESIELVGLVSNICVLSNAVVAKTACPNTPIIVDAACTASADQSMHEKCLDVLEGIHVSVINR